MAGGTGEAGIMSRELHLDNRGLEPPQPMVRVLEVVDTMGAGDVLIVHNDRRPVFLFPHLDERGFDYECEDQPDGSVIVRIQRLKSPGNASAETGSAEPAAVADAAGSRPIPPEGPQVELDVRHYHAQGREPFGDIMKAVGALQSGEQLVLLNTFEPVPLYKVLAKQGFRHHAEKVREGDYRIIFWRE